MRDLEKITNKQFPQQRRIVVSREFILKNFEIWNKEIIENMESLSLPQANTLAQASFAMAITKQSGRSTVAEFLANMLEQNQKAVQQRLREFYCEKSAKSNPSNRSQLEIENSFVDLFHWILKLWDSDILFLALDASTISDRFTILSANIIYQGQAFPVAWKILPGNQKHPWNPEWKKLLRTLKKANPSPKIVVLTDRGLYSPELFKFICSLNWHPLMRVTKGTFKATGNKKFKCFKELVPCEGISYKKTGVAFKSSLLECSFIGLWEYGYKEAWYLLTDLKPQEVDANWYSFRSCIEMSYRTSKRGGFQLQHTKIQCPQRLERWYLCFALAFLYLVRIGEGQEELKEVLESETKGTSPTVQKKKKSFSLWRQGWFSLFISLLFEQPLNLAQKFSFLLQTSQKKLDLNSSEKFT